MRDENFSPETAGPPRRRRRIVASVLIVAVILLTGGAGVWAGWLASQGDGNPGPASHAETPTPTPADEAPGAEQEPEPEPEPKPEPEPADVWNIDRPESITVVVNKQRPLDPKEWEPRDLIMPEVPNNNGQPLRAPAAKAIERMYRAASEAGAPFVIASAYRPYQMQVELFDSYVARDGVEAAETYSARAGHSEHQTGLVADVDDGSGCAFSECFASTAAGTWIRANAHRYGFVVRYPEGSQAITGYIYEPFHLRYVGPKVARDMRAQGISTLEEYFGLPAAPSY